MAKKAQIDKSKYQHEVTINGTTVIKETKTPLKWFKRD